MERRHQIDLFGASLLVAFSALLGLNQVMVKLVNAGMHPVFQAGLRSACAFLPVLLFALLMRRRISISDGSFWPGIVVGLLFAFEFVLLFSALDWTTVARASIFFYTMPLWVALAAHFLVPGERLTVPRVCGLLAALLGVLLALGYNDSPASPLALLGDVLCLVAAMAWAAIAIISRVTALSRARPEMQLLYQLGVSAPLLLILAPFVGEIWREPTPMIWAIFTFQVLIVVSVGFLTWFWVLSIYPASDMAAFSFLAPVFGVLFGWLILDERLGANVVGALLLVALGIVLVNRRQRPLPAD